MLSMSQLCSSKTLPTMAPGQMPTSGLETLLVLTHLDSLFPTRKDRESIIFPSFFLLNLSRFIIISLMSLIIRPSMLGPHSLMETNHSTGSRAAIVCSTSVVCASLRCKKHPALSLCKINSSFCYCYPSNGIWGSTSLTEHSEWPKEVKEVSLKGNRKKEKHREREREREAARRSSFPVDQVDKPDHQVPPDPVRVHLRSHNSQKDGN